MMGAAWWQELGDPVVEHKPMSEVTSMRTGGVARFFCSPSDPGRLGAVIERCRAADVEVRFLGGATNVIVVSDVVDAMVVRIHTPAMASLACDGERVTAGAGLRMERLVDECTDRGLSGLECMTWVPGTVGGAVMSNAATRTGRFLDVVDRVETVGPSGSVEWCGAGDIPGGHAVTRCELLLEQGDSSEIRRRLEEEMAHRRATQPRGVPSAGCVFRNPENDSAGRLIEEAGLKGRRVGDARVSDVHANFIVNTGSATGHDIIELIELVRGTVRDASGVELETEVEIW